MTKTPANILSWDLVAVGDTILHNDELVKVTRIVEEPEEAPGAFFWITYKRPFWDREMTFMAASDWLVAVVDSSSHQDGVTEEGPVRT